MRALAGLEMPLGEIPIIAATVQKQKLYSIRRLPVDHKARHDLFFGGIRFDSSSSRMDAMGIVYHKNFLCYNRRQEEVRCSSR